MFCIHPNWWFFWILAAWYYLRLIMYVHLVFTEQQLFIIKNLDSLHQSLVIGNTYVVLAVLVISFFWEFLFHFVVQVFPSDLEPFCWNRKLKKGRERKQIVYILNIYNSWILSVRVIMSLTGQPALQPRSQSSSAISDVTSPVKLVGKIRARFQASLGYSDSANRPGYEAASLVNEK